MQLQRRKSLKYAEKQHFQDYLTVPIEFSRFLELQPSQTMKCTVNGKGVLVYSAVEQKPITERLIYQKWLDVVAKLTPTTWPGKTYSQICREGSISLRSAPALWVRQAENDLGLRRSKDPRTHRILWTRSALEETGPTERDKLKDTKLTDKNYIEPKLVVSEFKD